jgi:hypothetical protein
MRNILSTQPVQDPPTVTFTSRTQGGFALIFGWLLSNIDLLKWNFAR